MFFLGYLTTGNVNFLSQDAVSSTLQQYEGNTGDMELLHPCAEVGAMTKYPYLFTSHARARSYRWSFFLNSAHNATSASWMLNALTSLHDELMDSRRPEDAALVQELRELASTRYTCFGSMQRPPGCTYNLAWSVLGKCVAHPRYWLSTQEVQMVGSVHECEVIVLRFADDRDDVEVYDAHVSDVCSQTACLAFHTPPGQSRGHYSRMFSLREWHLHKSQNESANTNSSPDDSAVSSNEDSEEGCDVPDEKSCRSSVEADEDEEKESEKESHGDKTKSVHSGSAAGDTDGEEDIVPPDIDIDVFSDISDNSDIFHVEAEKRSTWITNEDAEQQLIVSLVPHLREFPLLPPHPHDLQKSFTDVQSGVKYSPKGELCHPAAPSLVA